MSNPAPPARAYRVFISYSHADNREIGRRWASWLQEALERYEVPVRLIGTTGYDGRKIPETLFPVFRDEEELAAHSDLSEKIREALDHSDWLVVLCSPRAARSRYVNDEIRHFKEQPGKARRILGLILEGEPFASRMGGTDASRECLPEAMRKGVPVAGGVIDWSADAEPVCADTRPEERDAQGFTVAQAYKTSLRGLPEDEIAGRAADYAKRLEIARMKIIAGIVGVPLGELIRNTNKYRVQRLQRALAIVGVLLFTAVAAALWALWAQDKAKRERRAAEHANAQANHLINEMLFDLGDKLKPLGQLNLLADVSEAARDYFAGMPEGRDEADVTLQRAVMWLSRGDVLEALKSDKEALECYRTAQETLKPLGGGDPPLSAAARRYYAISFERIADVQEDADPAESLATAGKAIAILETLLARTPAGPLADKLCQDLGQAHERMGDIYEDGASNIAKAREHFEKSRDFRKDLSGRNQNDAGFQRDYGVACARIGDLLKMEGRYEEARAAFEEGLGIRQNLLRKHGLNSIWVGEIGRSHESLGLVREALGLREEALKAHSRALEIRRSITDYNPSDKKMAGDHARSCLAVARLLIDREPKEARRLLDEARTFQLARMTDEKPDLKVGLDLVATLRLEAAWELAGGRLEAALEFLADAEQRLEMLAGIAGIKAADNTKLDRFHALVQADRGRIFHRLGKLAAGAGPLAIAAERLRGLAESNRGNVEFEAERAWIAGLHACSRNDAAGLAESLRLLLEMRARKQLPAEAEEWISLLQTPAAAAE